MVHAKLFGYLVILLVFSFDFHTKAKSSEHGTVKHANCRETLCVTSLHFGRGQASRQVVRTWSMTDKNHQMVRGKRQSALPLFPIQPFSQYQYLPPSYLPVFPTAEVVHVIPHLLQPAPTNIFNPHSTSSLHNNQEKDHIQAYNPHLSKPLPASNCNGQFVPILRDPNVDFQYSHKTASSLENNKNPSISTFSQCTHISSLPRDGVGHYRKESQSHTVGTNSGYHTNSRAVSQTKINMEPPTAFTRIPSVSSNFFKGLHGSDNDYESQPKIFDHVGPQPPAPSNVGLLHGVQLSSTQQASDHYNSKPAPCNHNMGFHYDLPQPPAPPDGPKAPTPPIILYGVQKSSRIIQDYHGTRWTPSQNHDAGYYYGHDLSVDINDPRGPQPPVPPLGGPKPPAPPNTLYGIKKPSRIIQDYHGTRWTTSQSDDAGYYYGPSSIAPPVDINEPRGLQPPAPPPGGPMPPAPPYGAIKLGNYNRPNKSEFLGSTYTTGLEGPPRPPDPLPSIREMNYQSNDDKGYYYGPHSPSPTIDITTEQPIPQPPAPPPGGPMPPAPPPPRNGYGTQLSSFQYTDSADQNSLGHNVDITLTSNENVNFPVGASYPPPVSKGFHDPEKHITPRPPSPPPVIGYNYPHPRSIDLNNPSQGIQNPQEFHFTSPVNYETHLHSTVPYGSLNLYPESHEHFEDNISKTQVSIVPSLSFSFADMVQEGTISSPVFLLGNKSSLHNTKSVIPDGRSSSEIEVTDINCMRAGSGGYFRARLRSLSSGNAPVLENARSCPLNDLGDTIWYNLGIREEEFEQCGVKECFNFEESTKRPLCAAIRIPKLPGLRTPEDTIFTIECYPNAPVNVQTKSLSFQSPSYVVPRGVISGGSEARIASEMALYLRPPGSIHFSRRISLDDPVRLGDEIQLRCVVRDGDGWQYSRLQDITLHRRSSEGIQIEDSVVLVGPDGCRNPAMKSVCPWQPVQHSERPLTSSFTWKAFGFQDKGNENEDLVVSARVMACVHPSDCLLDTSSCTDETQITRTRRHGVKTNNETVLWRSDLTFKITKSSDSS